MPSRGKKVVNILNESGQSVPDSFDEEASGAAYGKGESIGAPPTPHLYGELHILLHFFPCLTVIFYRS